MQSTAIVRALLPLSLLSYATAVVANLLVFSPSLPAFGSLPEGTKLERTLDQSLREVMPFRETAIGLLGAIRYRWLGQGGDGVVVGKDSWLFTREELVPHQVDITQALAKIDEAAAQLKEAAIPLLIVALPAKVDLAAAQSVSAVSEPARDLHAAFVSALEGAGHAVLDATRALEECRLLHDCVFRTDTHWTPAGARQVADAVALQGLPTGTTEFAQRPLDREVFYGDLVRFVTTDAFAPRAGLPQEFVTPFVAEEPSDALAASDLFGAAATPAYTLVGTSFSADRRWSFAEALKLSLKSDVTNLAQKGAGPWRPMERFLSDLDPSASAPLAVIWEIPSRYVVQTAMWETAS